MFARILVPLDGSPLAEEILDHAQARQVDLIVMSTHGRSGIQRWVLGSAAEAVLRVASVPVLLLRATEPVAASHPSSADGGTETAAGTGAARPQRSETPVPVLRQILCPVDFSQASDEALAYAGALAQRFRADLTVLHVVHDPLDITCSHIPHPPLEQLRDEMVRGAEGRLQRRVRQVLASLPQAKTAVLAGPPYKQIVRYACESQADLIVMGTRGATGLDRLVMGSTAERVVRLAPCPVVSMRAAS